MFSTFKMMVTKIDEDNNEVRLWAPGDFDTAETEMIWRYDKDIKTIGDKLGDVYNITLNKIAGR